MPRPVWTVNLSPRPNRYTKAPSPWWFALQVLVLGVLVYVILALVMVG